jgi:hypothetical protein
MFTNWYADVKVVQSLHEELLRAADMRRLARIHEHLSMKTQRRGTRRLAGVLALLGMQ